VELIPLQVLAQTVVILCFLVSPLLVEGVVELGQMVMVQTEVLVVVLEQH
jgi:hypothetical protein